MKLQLAHFDQLIGRRQFVGTLAKAAGSLPLAVSRGSSAQLQGVPRIGFLIRDGYSQLVDAFSRESARLGHADGETVVIGKRYSRSDLRDLPAQATELARSNVTLILAASLPQALAVRQVNPRMAMVIATCAGMVSNGFAKSVGHPAGNATGIDELPPGVTAKRLSLLKLAAPEVVRVALLSTSEGVGGFETQLGRYARMQHGAAATSRISYILNACSRGTRGRPRPTRRSTASRSMTP